MKIQVIGFSDKTIKYSGYDDITYSTINKPFSLDMYNINIISLQNSKLWFNKGSDTNSINNIDDISSLGTMLRCSKKAFNIIAYPQNYEYSFYYNKHQSTYQKSTQIKNIIDRIIPSVMCRLSIENGEAIIYENCKSKCNNNEYLSAFVFHSTSNVLTKSVGSEKSTTICYSDHMLLTTIDFTTSEMALKDFFVEIGIDEEQEEIPEWLTDYCFFNDREQNEIISDKMRKIKDLEFDIDKANEILKTNLRYKSILIESGARLVSVVVDILQKMMNYDLSEFIDEKKEDFLIKLDDITFIGEIKGVTSNVKSEFVSQLEVHVQGYNDKLEEKEQNENVKGILIINPLRNRPQSERDEVHEKQIHVAKRYGSLIITTDVLLTLFEKYLNGNITSEAFINKLSEKTGVLTVDDFN
ncbi:MAG: hypothetical protein IJH37_00750 [Clostridia bacterium]|nr:hypothetical protein [Clostridia bacterium]